MGKNRTVVTNYETGKITQPIDKKEIIKTTSVDDEEIYPSLGSPTRKPRIIRAMSEKKIKPIPQVQLDPTSIDYISKLINEKITRELAARDKKILDQVHDIVNQALSQVRKDDQQPFKKGPGAFISDPGYDSLTDYENKSVNSAQSVRGQSKIPRIKLPKINTSEPGGKPSSRNGRNSADGPLSLPQIKPKASSDRNKAVKEEQLSMEGVQYPQCRSVVYPSVNDIELLKTRHLRKPPKLLLRHIFGYDGDPSRHGGSIKGKNIVWLSDREIAFPAAAVVVVMDIVTEKQKFFINHTDDVISLATYSPLSVMASSQLGSDGSILVWNYRDLNANCEMSPCQQLLPSPQVGLRGINNLCFSPDGKLLLACGIEDSRVVYIFDWQKNVLLTSTKTGHSDSCQFQFNSFCYQSFTDVYDQENRQSLQKKGFAADDIKANPVTAGCYSIVSYSSKILKFWTLKQVVGLPASSSSSSSKYKDPKSKQNRGNNVQYIFEGNQGTTAAGMKKMNNNHADYSSVCAVGYDERLTYLLVGLTNGAIQVWKQMTEVVDGKLSWIGRGKLVLVIADVHEGPITEMDYSFQEGKLVTSDMNGVLNVWNVILSSTTKITEQAPLEHIGAIELDTGTNARSLTWNLSGSAISIGASNNSISILKLNPLTNNGLTEFDLQALLTAHNGKVRRLAVHPLQDNYFATICSDSTIRIWDSELKVHVSCIYMEVPATAVSFSADGTQLAVGNEKGELIILTSREFENLLANSKKSLDQPFQFEWKLLDSKVVSSNPSKFFWSSSISFLTKIPTFLDGGKSSKKKLIEVTEIRYSPTEDLVAVGLKDGTIHLLSTRNGYRHLAICRGHTSQIKNIDFSLDGKIIKSSDGSRELLFWDVNTGQQLTNSNYYREQQWSSFSCIYGWGLQGVFNRFDGEKLIQPDSEINCVGRSPDGLIVASAGSHTVQSAIKLFQYPAISDAIPSGQAGGHTSPVLDIAFTGPDDYLTLISAGGNDSCIFLWEVVYESN